MSSCSEVVPGLFVGSEKAAIMPDVEKFKSVINVTKEIPFSKCLESDVQTHRFDLLDMGEASEQATMFDIFQRSMPVIDKCMPVPPVLVHCEYGEQRSCTLTAAYLMWKLGYSAREAIEVVKTAHRPAFGCGTYVHFQSALELWQKHIQP